MSFFSFSPNWAACRISSFRKSLVFLPLVAASCLVVPSPAAAELPLKYLPDGTNMLISIHFQEIHDCPMYQNLEKELPDFAKGEESFGAAAGVTPDNMAQVTMAGNVAGKGDEGQPTVIIQTRNAVAAEKVKDAMKPQKYQKDFKIDEVKVGEYTIYDPTYHIQFERPGSKAFHGEAFVVVEGNIVLESRNIDGLRKILQRGKPAELSETMQGLVKDADASKTMVYAIDLKAVAADEQFLKSLQDQLGPLMANNGDLLKQFESLSVDASLKDDDAVLRATLACKDSGAAADAKKMVEVAQVVLRKMIETLPRAPQDVAESVGSITLTAENAKLKAGGKVKVESIVKWVRAEYENARNKAMQHAEELRRLQEQARPRNGQQD
jgi:hypothetical protein